MKLIKKLEPEIYQGQKVYNAIFECEECGKQVKRNFTNGKRAKSCGCLKVSGWKQRRESGEWIFNGYSNQVREEALADYIPKSDYTRGKLKYEEK